MSFFMKLALFFLDYLPLWIILVIRLSVSGAKDNGVDVASWVCVSVLVGTTVIAGGYVIRKLCVVSPDDVEDMVVVSCKKMKTLTWEHLAAYLFPVMAFELSSCEGLCQFAVVFTAMGFLAIKNDLFQGNLFLEICGYYFFECECKIGDGTCEVRRVFIRGSVENHENIVGELKCKVLTGEWVQCWRATGAVSAYDRKGR